MKLIANIGDKHGLLTIIGLFHHRGRRKAHCVCDCGNKKDVFIHHLIRDGRKTVSCGCHKKRLCSNLPPVIKHGHCSKVKSPTYQSWLAMMQRCYRTKHPAYHRYGGRGITVQIEWHDFQIFLQDMGERPGEMELDRKDNDLSYYNGNCRWVTPKVNARNKSSNRVLTFRGKSKCMSEWAEEVGMNVTTLRERLSRGWTVEHALSKPVGRSRFS